MLSFLDYNQNYKLNEDDSTDAWINKTSKDDLQSYLKAHNPTDEVKQKILAAINQKSKEDTPQAEPAQTLKKSKTNPDIVIGKQFKSKKFNEVWTIVGIIDSGDRISMKSSKGIVMVFNTKKVLDSMTPI